MLKDIIADIHAINSFWIKTILSNRGFHALLIYRISNVLWRNKIPILPLILTRVIHILYGIDIDWRASIKGGVSIIHGVGLVIGSGVKIGPSCKIYHGVTIGIANSINDGFPTIDEGVLIGAGAKILGPVHVGKGAKIGANAVVLHDVPDYMSAVGIPAKIVNKK